MQVVKSLLQVEEKYEIFALARSQERATKAIGKTFRSCPLLPWKGRKIEPQSQSFTLSGKDLAGG